MTVSRKWFLLAATFVTMGSAFVYSPSIASTEPLSPKSASWVINDVRDDDHPYKSYCTAKNKYDTGLQLIWARNQMGDTSFAIDYQKPVFDPDKTLNVVVSSSDVVRDFDIKASSTEAIVVRLKEDPTFWHALKTTKLLNTEIGGNLYEFAMPQIDKADEKLNTCLTKLQNGNALGDIVNNITDDAHVILKNTVVTEALNQEKNLLEDEHREDFEMSKNRDNHSFENPETVVFNATRTIEKKNLKPLEALQQQNANRYSGEEDIILHKSDLVDVADSKPYEPEMVSMAQSYEQEIKLSDHAALPQKHSVTTPPQLQNEDEVVIASLEVIEPMQETITFAPAPLKHLNNQVASNNEEPPTYYTPLDNSTINSEVERIEQRELQQQTQVMNKLQEEQQKLKDQNTALRVELGMMKAQQESTEQAIQNQKTRVSPKPLVVAAAKTTSGVVQSTIQQAPSMRSVDTTNVQSVIAAIDPRGNVKSSIQKPKPVVQHAPETVRFNNTENKSREPEKQNIIVSAHAMDFEDIASNNDFEPSLSESQKHENMLMQKMKIKQPSYPVKQEVEAAVAQEAPPVYTQPLQETYEPTYQAYSEPEQAPIYNKQTNTYTSDAFIENILSDAQIQTSDAVQMIEPAAGDSATLYQWQSYGVYASAEQIPASDVSNFESYVSEYLERTQSRCTGDFSIVPDQSFGEGIQRVDSYEIACLSDAGNSSASILFFINQGNFTSIAHETAIDDLDAAMDLRDRILSVISPA